MIEGWEEEVLAEKYYYQEITNLGTFKFANTISHLFLDFSLQIEELKEVPEQSEKAIADLKGKQERLEKEKKKEEDKLKEVMDSLKTETQVNISPGG